MSRFLCPAAFVVLSVCTMFAASSRAPAAGAEAKKSAITDLALVDDDYAIQGEYLGLVTDSGTGQRQVGLQVAARGGGKFEALRYEGGLPGNGWDQVHKSRLSGALEEGVLRLSGPQQTILATGCTAEVLDEAGQPLGSLQKVRRRSSTLDASPPAKAIVLFDGSSPEQLQGATVTEDGLLNVGPTTKMPVGDFRLHLEFCCPYMPSSSSQGRGNSGVYIQRRYEVQILDSFGLEPAFNDCGALYRQQPPDLNMSFPPLHWQTYDIWFTAARWDEAGNKSANARITVLHNGVPIHADREIMTKTGAGMPEGPELLPILFQNHGDPVRFRNIWIVLEVPGAKEPVLLAKPMGRGGRCGLLRRILLRVRCCR